MKFFELYIDQTETGLDVNSTATATSWIHVSSCEQIMVYVESKTGTSATFEMSVEVSPDGTFNGGVYTENASQVKLQGEGYLQIYDSSAIEYLRVKCSIAEGSAATADVYIQGIRKSN